MTRLAAGRPVTIVIISEGDGGAVRLREGYELVAVPAASSGTISVTVGADLGGVDLSEVILNEADLSGVNLSEAYLKDADISEAILLGTDLSCANLYNANLSGSNLSGAIFNGADLRHTNLSYAILDGADLSQANLENTILNEDLEWENVRGLDKAVNIPDCLKEKFKLS